MTGALALTLVHFLWQGLAAAMLLAGALVLLRRSTASARYLAACAALAFTIMAPLVTFTLLARMSVAGHEGLAAATALTERLTRIEVAGADTQAAPGVEATGLALVQPAIVAVWIAGVVLVAVWHVVGWWRLQRLTTLDVADPPAPWIDRFAALRRKLNLSARVRLRVSGRVDTPMVVGWLRPLVLMPAAAMGGLSADQLEWILVHELTHVRRHDYLINLLQISAETLLFYHPAVWWISAVIRREREHCCDDAVVAAGGDPLGYARALLRLEDMRTLPMRLAPAATGGSLLARIQRLTGGRTMNRHSLDRPHLAGLFAVAILLIGGAALALAADAETVTGDWNLRERGDRTVLRLEAWDEDGDHRSNMSMRLDESEASGIKNAEVSHELARDAGTFVLVRDGSKSGEFTFTSDPAFARFLAGHDVDDLDAHETFVLAAADVDREFVEGLDELGFDDLDGGELIAAGIHGASPDYIREMQSLGYRDRDLDTYLAMRIHGADREYVEAMREAGHQPEDTDQLIAWRVHGISPEYVAEMTRAGHDLDDDDLLSWKIHGVDERFISEMNELGFATDEADELVAMRIHGVTPEYVQATRELGYDLDVDDLLAWRIHGVTAAYIGDLARLGYDDLDADDLVAMRIHGVSARWIEKLQARGIDLSVDDLIQLKISGVDVTKARL